MDVGAALLERARSIGRRSIAVVGTGKNVGKTVTIGAICAALERADERFAVVSIGRDGERVDSLTGTPKPRLRLGPQTLFVTTPTLLAPGPAVEIVAATGERSAVGPIVLARVRVAGAYEIAGPPSVAAVRRVLAIVREHGAPFVVLDGAVDRTAILGGGDEAIVVATGAASGTTVTQVAREAQALVARLSLPRVDPALPALRIDGALTASHARALIEARESRQIVVHDATRIAFGGAAFLAFASRLDLRCDHVLAPIAATIASFGPATALEPLALLRAVAVATALPAYDVFAQAVA